MTIRFKDSSFGSGRMTVEKYPDNSSVRFSLDSIIFEGDEVVEESMQTLCPHSRHSPVCLVDWNRENRYVDLFADVYFTPGKIHGIFTGLDFLNKATFAGITTEKLGPWCGRLTNYVTHHHSNLTWYSKSRTETLPDEVVIFIDHECPEYTICVLNENDTHQRAMNVVLSFHEVSPDDTAWCHCVGFFKILEKFISGVKSVKLCGYGDSGCFVKLFMMYTVLTNIDSYWVISSSRMVYPSNTRVSLKEDQSEYYTYQSEDAIDLSYPYTNNDEHAVNLLCTRNLFLITSNYWDDGTTRDTNERFKYYMDSFNPQNKISILLAECDDNDMYYLVKTALKYTLQSIEDVQGSVTMPMVLKLNTEESDAVQKTNVSETRCVSTQTTLEEVEPVVVELVKEPVQPSTNEENAPFNKDLLLEAASGEQEGKVSRIVTAIERDIT